MVHSDGATKFCSYFGLIVPARSMYVCIYVSSYSLDIFNSFERK